MKDKLIIHNYTNLEDLDIIDLVHDVISLGKISKTSKGEQYCFLTVNKIFNVVIDCTKNNNTYTFKIYYND